jgi:Uma2 family endonuclease
MTTVSRTMTMEEFAHYATTHGRCELIRGEVRSMSPAGMRRGDITNRMNFFITAFVYQHKLGKVYTAETGFRLDDDGNPTVRAPDVAFIAFTRLTGVNTASFCPIAPDLVVETLSPDDRAADVAEKIQWWLDRGVKLVWIVDPEKQVIDIRHGEQIHRLRIGDTLTGGEVLPGFACAVAEVFA